jgi:hypothetical protein
MDKAAVGNFIEVLLEIVLSPAELQEEEAAISPLGRRMSESL